jgi:integrase
VSKGWVSRLVARYRAEGEAAFVPRSRRPKSSPTAITEQTVELIVRLREQLAEQGLDAGPDTNGLTVDQAKDVLRVAAPDRLASRWLFAFLTGTRQGETLGLRWSHVDLRGGVADIRWSLQRIPYVHGCSDRCGRRAAWCPQRWLGVPAGLEHEVLDGNLVLVPPKTSRSRRLMPLAPPLLAALSCATPSTSTSATDTSPTTTLCGRGPTVARLTAATTGANGSGSSIRPAHPR